MPGLQSVKEKYWAWRSSRRRTAERLSSVMELKHLEHPRALAIAVAIEKAFATSKPEPSEQDWIERIEALRVELAASEEVLPHIDFGAGEPEAAVSGDVAQQGVRQEVKISHLAAWSSVVRPWSDLIFYLVRELRPETCLELGTCIGISASYQGGAMTLNGGGRIVSLEGGEAYAARARAHMDQLGVDRCEIVVGRFEDTLDETLNSIGKIDFMFNDGHHDGDAMIQYFDMIHPYLAENAVLLFDDISNYESMQEGWRKLMADERVNLVVDFGKMGLVSVGTGGDKPSVFNAPI